MTGFRGGHTRERSGSRMHSRPDRFEGVFLGSNDDWCGDTARDSRGSQSARPLPGAGAVGDTFFVFLVAAAVSILLHVPAFYRERKEGTSSSIWSSPGS